ncbi:Laccase-2 [Termitomyces sp. T112]|nr:Laccase-2 [Termitomyces sp. T112]
MSRAYFCNVPHREGPCDRVYLTGMPTLSVQHSRTAAGRKKNHHARVFSSVADISSVLRSQNHESMILDLTALRNHLSIRPGEDAITLQDARLLLVKDWLNNVHGAHDIFGLWDSLTQRQNSLLAVLISILSSLLTLTSSHYTYQALGQPIIKTILAQTYTRRLNSYLGGSHAELILVTLKLFNAMSSFAGGREKKSVSEAFGWELKSLPKLLNMRRKSTSDTFDALAKPDIRTLYILFILSFVGSDSPAQAKATFIEQHREPFLSIFKGLVQDSYSIIRRVLEICWAGLWSDPKIKRTLKINLFNEITISHLLKLYDRKVAEDDDPDHVPADLVHHFLLAICTRPGTGICFKDRGWYPRESDGEDEPGRGKIYNRILANVLKTLKVNEDLRQQELALKILAACPELVAGYWSGAALTLEPRLSSKWIANISFFGSVLSQPVPTWSFHLIGTALYQPTPPPLSTIIESILPSVHTKVHFTRGLQSTSGLVQHCTALALAKCLAKYEDVLKLFLEVKVALEENETEGQWSRRRKDVEKEVRRRVPDFQVIVAFSQQKFVEVPGTTTTTSGVTAPTSNVTRIALLSESAHRLLWMYQRCLPMVVAEARFDVGKLLQGFAGKEKTTIAESGDEEMTAAMRLHVVQQLHVLRLLKDSDQFGWSGRIGSTSQSYLTVLLNAFITTNIHAIRMALSDLLEYTLGESIMFQDDPTEPHLWLLSLPTSHRRRGTESPDGAILTDEGESVITFLDDCVQRCLKTPYRYLEDLHVLAELTVPQSQSMTDRDESLPGPLLMTVLEQLEIKVSKKMLSPSDVLAIASFVRKLVFRLSSNQQDLGFLRAVADKFSVILQAKKLFPDYPVITSAVRKEIDLLRMALFPDDFSLQSVSDEAKAFLSIIEEIPVSTTKEARKSSAYELVDWLRLVDGQFGSHEIARVVAVLTKLYPPALSMVLESLSPETGSLWKGLDVGSLYPEARTYLLFDYLFLHAGPSQIADGACREVLSQAAFGCEPNLGDGKRAVRLVGHRLAGSYVEQTRDLFFLLGSILKRGSIVLPSSDFMILKEAVFIRSNLKPYLISGSLSNAEREGLHHLIREVLDPTNPLDRELLAIPSAYWLGVLMSDTINDPAQFSLASPWINYIQHQELFSLLDSLSSDSLSAETLVALLEPVLSAIKLMTTSKSEPGRALIHRMSLLLSLYSMTVSTALEELIAIAIQSSLPAYHDGGQCREAFDETNLIDVVKRAESRWSRGLDVWPTDLPVQSFLSQDSWTASTVAIVSGLLYSGHLPRDSFISWLSTDHCTARSPEHFIIVVHAFFDVVSSGEEELAEHDCWITHFSRILHIVLDNKTPQSIRLKGGACLSLMACFIPSNMADFLAILVRTVQTLPVSEIYSELLLIGQFLHARLPRLTGDFIKELVNHGIQWAIRYFTEEEDPSLNETLIDLTSLVHVAVGIKPHLAETVLGVAIQSRLSHLAAVEFVTALLPRVHLKPVVVNRHLQGILQHANFFKYCGNVSPDTASMRDAVVQLLHTLFNLHLANTCQITHIEPLIKIYRGTLSKADGLILSIFRLFETERKVAISSILCQWSPTPNLLSSTSLEAIQGLDPILVLRTCLNFPSWRRLDDLTTEKASSHEVQLYDPIFLMLLFAQMLAENPPESGFAWVEVFRTNIVSLFIRALSSKCEMIRDIALCQLAGLWQYLENADLQERVHVLHILTLLKNVLPVPSNGPPRRLPSYTTLLLSHSLRGIFYPSNFIYPITARFLLQRPELDINDVPLLYNMLYCSSDDWKKERGWMIRFLSDGMMSTDDWKVFKGRHTWDLLASLFQCSEDDRAFRAGILDVLANLTCNVQATTSLILKSGLLSWIEIQLMTSSGVEGVEWVKILDNIMTIVDPGKLELSTGGEWRAVICRCLLILLDDPKSSNAFFVFPLAIAAALRLSLLPGPQVANLALLIQKLVACLRDLEGSVTVPPSISSRPLELDSHPRHLYRSHTIHETQNCAPLQVWGQSVEALWRILMTLKDASELWGVVTSRILVWRAISGTTDGITEWTRAQVICNMAGR